MDKKDKIQERKELNKPFITAFDWIREQKGLTQDEFAKVINTNGSLVSLYRNGKKLVGPDMKMRLARQFGGRLYLPYLDGLSPYMLVDNVPARDAIIEDDLNNPDYVQLQKDKQKSEQYNNPEPIIDLYASLIKELEAMRKDLASELSQVRQLRYELIHEREAMQSITQQLTTILHPHPAQYEPSVNVTPLAAEPN